MVDTNRLPYEIVDYGAGPRALRSMREQTAPLSELSYPAAADSFAAWTSALHLRSAILFESRTSQLRFDRSALHVARSSVDHYQAVVHLRGTSQLAAGKCEITLSPGDVGIMDLALTNRTVTTPASSDHLVHSVTLTMPRASLAPLLAAPDAIGCQLIRGETA